jgi:hypothetical protein
MKLAHSFSAYIILPENTHQYWRYGKTREFRVKLNFAPKNSRNSRVLPYRQYLKWPADVAVWKLAHSFSVYIILPENTQQYLFTAADNSMEHFPLAICDFQTTFLKTRIKATEV